MKSTLVMWLSMLLLGLPMQLVAQSISLTEAYEKLEANYPLLSSATLNDQILATDLDIISLEQKPQLLWKASANLQSETTTIEGESLIPLEIDLPLYSARTYAEANYTILDGGLSEARIAQKKAETAVANQQLEVERFALRDRVNQLFLGVMLNRERIALFGTTFNDLAEREKVLSAGVGYGTVLESELLKVKVRQIEIEAERDNLVGVNRSLLANLSTLVGEELDEAVELVLPDLPPPNTLTELDRPEFKLFELQKAAIMSNADLVDAAKKPQLQAFVQAGVGVPNPLNLFDNGVAPYALGGLNFQMPITDWKKSKRQKELLNLQALQMDKQKETLEFNLTAGDDAYLRDLERVRDQMDKTREILALQNTILEQLAAQLDNGVITTNDYLTQSNIVLSTRQQLELYETEITQLQINFLNQRGAL